MKHNYLAFLVVFGIFLFLHPGLSFGQCPQFFEDAGNGNILSANPHYIGCGGTNYTINVASTTPLGPYTIVWGDGSPNSTGSSLGSLVAVPHTYTYPPSDTFELSITANGCTVNGFVVVETPVTAAIQIPDGGLGFCAPKSKDFINASLNTSITTEFNWDFGDGTTLPMDYTNAGDTIPHTYQPLAATCLIEVTLTAENYCSYGVPSTARFQFLKIWDIDKAAITPNPPELCWPDNTFTFTNTSEYNCTGPGEGNTSQRYEKWNFGKYWGNTSDSIIDWAPRFGIPRVISYPGVGIYNVKLVDSNYCGKDSIIIQVEIVNPPVANMTASDTIICAGESITFFENATGGADNFSWNFEGSWMTGMGPGNRSHTFNIAGNYTVYMVALRGSTGCGDTVSVNIDVLQSPTAGINIDNQSACDSLTVTFTDNSTGSPVSWDWDFGNGNTSTAQNPGTQFYKPANNYMASLTVTNALNCSNTVNQPIDVYETPVPNFSPRNICVNQLAQFIDSSTSAAGDPIISWTWNFGDGSPTSNLQNPTHTYLSAATFNVILDVTTAHCSAQGTIPVVAEQLPIAGFSMDTTYGCAPLLVNFTNTSSVNSAGFYWDFGDGDTSTSVAPTHTFLNNFGVDTTYGITLIAFTTFGCTDTMTQTVTVFPNPNAMFTDNSATIKCTPAVIDFINQSTGGASSYLWTLGNGHFSTAVNPTDTFYNTGFDLDTVVTRLVAYTSNGCSDTASKEYIIFPKPGGIPPFIDSGCTPLEVHFPEVIGAVNLIWDFGDLSGGTGSQPVHSYFNNDSVTKVFTVTLISRTGAFCRDTSSGIVKVYHKPDATILSNTGIGCQPLDVGFINLSKWATIYHWDYDDGFFLDTIGLNTSHTFYNTLDNSVLYNVKMTAETQFGCTDVDSVPIRVHPSVVAGFTGDSVGCSPFGAAFTNTSSSAASIWDWDFGDGKPGSTTKNPIHGYVSSVADTFVVRLIASSVDGCSDTAYSEVAVFPSPNANFSINPPSNTLTYPDTIFGIQNLDLKWSYIWDFGDGDSSTASIPGSKAYTGWGSFIITLIAYNEHCTDMMKDTVTILPPLPIANFGELTKGCEDLTVEFVNKSKYAETYKWRFIHGITNAAQSSVDKDPVITFTDPGKYNVSLIATGEGGVDEKIELGFIEVYEQPEARFTFAPLAVYIPNEKVVCLNNSTGDNLSFTWDFGDGTVSNQENPEHFYTAEGEYTIILVATNQFCSDTNVSDSKVLARPSGSLAAPNAFTPRDGDEPGENGGLDFTSPGYDGFSNDVFYPKVVGEIKDYEFMVFNKWGEMLFRTESKTVGWTGWYRHRLCKMDVYVYKVKATMVDNSEVVLFGDLTLLR